MKGFLVIDPQMNTIVVNSKELCGTGIVSKDIKRHGTRRELLADVRRFLDDPEVKREGEVNT